MMKVRLNAMAVSVPAELVALDRSLNVISEYA